MADDNHVLSKATGLPAISIGLALSILLGTWNAAVRFRDLENTDTAVSVQVEDVADRQSKYIGQGGSLTQAVEKIEERVIALEAELSLLNHRIDQLEGRLP